MEKNLETLLLKELQELYGAEKHQLLVLPLLKKAATSLKLQNVLANHLDETREQITRLEVIFEKLGQTPSEVLSEAILGITRSAETAIGSTEKTTATRDAALIVAAQQLEHYEITSYGSVANHARTLEYDEVEDILEISLMEEKEEDDLLTALAENYINTAAAGQDS